VTSVESGDAARVNKSSATQQRVTSHIQQQYRRKSCCKMDFESLKTQVSNLTLYDLKAGVRKVQNGMFAV
jgi:hypothetical protein